jgi:nucleoside phosphorylase
LAHNIFCGEARDDLDGIMIEKLVIVPGIAMGVHEDVDVGQVIVVIDDISQVDHDFVAFIFRGMERRRWIIGYVDSGLNAVRAIEGPSDP